MFRSVRKKSETSQGFRKSLRNVSNTSTTVSTGLSTSSNLGIPKDAALRKTARKVSNSLKNKLKNLFKRGGNASVKSDHNPLQGIGSQHDGMDDVAGNEHQDRLSEPEDPDPEECTITEGAIRMPSLHAVPSHQQLRSRQGSLESIRSNSQRPSDDRSRVTSWASSAVTTLDSDKACHRLSVIKETGAHPGTVYSESTYSNDKPMSPMSEANVPRIGVAVPYSPAAVDDQPTYIQTYNPSMPFQTPVAQHSRVTSAASSVEWKTRLAAHVSREEQKAPSLRHESSMSTIRTGPVLHPGHVREKASIEEEEPMPLSVTSHNASRTTLGSYKSQAFSDTPKHPVRAGIIKTGGINSMQPPRVPARSSLRSIEPGNIATPSSIFAMSSRSAQSSLKTLRTMPDLRKQAREENKENAAPSLGFVPRSTSPAKLLRPSGRTAKLQLRSRLSDHVGQTTMLGSPVARVGDRAQDQRLSGILRKDPGGDLAGQDGGVFNSPGTQRMVDDFLSSRRRGISGDDESEVFV
ncbi:hypothetical protein F5X68DRAFT_253901 [Plectosphaerella plurivora]|uniref:Uncharacterized protein n=1 Tax=Plectosphaerella plurivora TaxID=936078 RepID=A0A9P9AE69_9PEZI|nr:hypothetical protein F5X68DRAFT_253901 [Plectosphaerella plurivora]